MFPMGTSMLMGGRSFLSCPDRLEFDSFAGPFGAFQTTGAVPILGVFMNMYIHGTSLVAFIEKRAGFSANNYLEEAESVEN